MAEDTFDAFHQIWTDYPVLRSRGQSLGDDALLVFSKKFEIAT